MRRDCPHSAYCFHAANDILPAVDAKPHCFLNVLDCNASFLQQFFQMCTGSSQVNDWINKFRTHAAKCIFWWVLVTSMLLRVSGGVTIAMWSASLLPTRMTCFFAREIAV